MKSMEGFTFSLYLSLSCYWCRWLGAFVKGVGLVIPLVRVQGVGVHRQHGAVAVLSQDPLLWAVVMA